MKSVSELTDFYYKNLYPTLEELEVLRKNLRDRILVVGVIYTTAFIVILFSFISIESITIDALIFLFFAYVAIGAFIYKFLTKNYTSDFKSRVIKPLIHAIDKNLSYFSDSHVSLATFEKSKLFTSSIDKYSGNDFVKGRVDGIDIKFSDVYAQKREKNSQNFNNYSTIFRGLFIVSEFNKTFHGETVVLPDSAQNTFGNLIGNWLQSNNFARDELVKMDDVEFEKEFVVYSTDQIEARYILSHALMEKLLILKKRSKHPLYISFIGANIHIAIEYDKDLFEPSIFNSLLKYRVAMEYIETLYLSLGIVRELKLNQRLWSKR